MSVSGNMTQLWEENVRSLEEIFINPKRCGRENFIIFLMAFAQKHFEMYNRTEMMN